MKRQNITILLNTEVKFIKKDNDTMELSLSDDTTLWTNAVLVATGRKPELGSLKLNNADITVDNDGLIKVNESYQTTQSHIYAVGDIIGNAALTPVAICEGRIVDEQLFADTVTQELDYDLIPTAIFGSPSISTCGFLTKKQ